MACQGLKVPLSHPVKQVTVATGTNFVWLQNWVQFAVKLKKMPILSGEAQRKSEDNLLKSREVVKVV